jgi:hypothetical protein
MMANGKAKQHFFHLAVASPNRPVNAEKIPPIIARIPKSAAGEGIV